MLNTARSVTYAANYDPYGQVMAQYLPNATPSFGFTGQMTDASGLQYLRARYYDPSTGTFLSQDPVQGMPGGASIRWNPYIYAGANPTNFIDPNGMTPLCPPGFVGQSCRQAFDSIATGFRAIFEGITAPARVTAEVSQKASQQVYETSQTHWAGSAAAGLIDPVDIAVTLNNWANRDFFILDPLAFLPVLSVGWLRSLFRHGDEVVGGLNRGTRNADNLKKEVQIIGFRGTGRPLPGENPLIQVGHVGVSIDDGRTIYGFHPHPDAVRELENQGVDVLEFLKRGGDKAEVNAQLQNLGLPSSLSGGALRGQLQDDTLVFMRAFELSQEGVRTNVFVLSQAVDELNYARIKDNIFRQIDEGSPYPSWYRFPNRAGGRMPLQCNNCATWPRTIGIEIPETSGQLLEYIEVLSNRGYLWVPPK